MKIAIIGRTEILYNCIELLRNHGHEIALIVTAKEAPEYTRVSQDFKDKAEELNIPFFHTAKIETIVDLLRELPDIDIGVSLNYSGVIPESVISLFRLGVLNAHGGDLPRYRGNACQAWAILNGEEKIGLCVHRMIGGELDSGDIVSREYLCIDIHTTITHVYSWMSERIPPMFLEAVEALVKDPEFVLERQSKDAADALRCYPRKPEDGLIRWEESSLQVLRLINASGKPYSGAFCYYKEQPMIIWEAMLGPEQNYLAVPGQVASIEDDGSVLVTTRDGLIRILKIEFQNKMLAPSKIIKSLRDRLS